MNLLSLSNSSVCNVAIQKIKKTKFKMHKIINKL